MLATCQCIEKQFSFHLSLAKILKFLLKLYPKSQLHTQPLRATARTPLILFEVNLFSPLNALKADVERKINEKKKWVSGSQF